MNGFWALYQMQKEEHIRVVKREEAKYLFLSNFNDNKFISDFAQISPDTMTPLESLPSFLLTQLNTSAEFVLDTNLLALLRLNVLRLMGNKIVRLIQSAV